ncbi:MAG: glycosyltransferase [Chitinophagaceae bacterium]|nr:glycosyltransferase [Rubrivivax sp.]
MTRPVLIVFSHLRWSFVFQRPQHLLSRLTAHWRVVFVEEPVYEAGSATLVSRRTPSGVEVVVPHTPVAAAGFHDDQIAVLQPLIAAHLRQAGLRCDVAWLYTPMALPLLAAVDPDCVVYDCMDDLASFKDAPRQLRQRESALMQRAVLVMTGGPSLFESRRHAHPNVHCLPSSVDAAHFDPDTLDPHSVHAREAAALQAQLPRPRLGYFGVIDERLDMLLIERLAERQPDWQIVMAGPVCKIDPARLPQGPNLHWLGMQPYERLPHLLAAWDAALMPFALNEATRHISPTKTLEYMAGEKPVVSTSVRDVISLYGHVVEVADTHEEFIRACEDLMSEPATARLHRVSRMLAAVATQSWDRVAERVHSLLLQAHAGAVRPKLVEFELATTAARSSAELSAATRA